VRHGSNPFMNAQPDGRGIRCNRGLRSRWHPVSPASARGQLGVRPHDVTAREGRRSLRVSTVYNDARGRVYWVWPRLSLVKFV
jgi:hypothetical protein